MNFRKTSTLEPPGFQLAPMLDIAFIMVGLFAYLQFFARLEMDNDISLPTTEKGVPPRRLPGEIILNIKDSGAITVSGRTLSREETGRMLRQLSATFPGQPIIIRADKATDWAHVMAALDLCKNADIWNISFASARADTSPEPPRAP